MSRACTRIGITRITGALCVAFDKLRQREQPVAGLGEDTILKWNGYNPRYKYKIMLDEMQGEINKKYASEPIRKLNMQKYL
jgi:hypothetical protein